MTTYTLTGGQKLVLSDQNTTDTITSTGQNTVTGIYNGDAITVEGSTVSGALLTMAVLGNGDTITAGAGIYSMSFSNSAPTVGSADSLSGVFKGASSVSLNGYGDTVNAGANSSTLTQYNIGGQENHLTLFLGDSQVTIGGAASGNIVQMNEHAGDTVNIDYASSGANSLYINDFSSVAGGVFDYSSSLHLTTGTLGGDTYVELETSGGTANEYVYFDESISNVGSFFHN